MPGPSTRQGLSGISSLTPLIKLRAFEAAARLGSISRAGAELSISVSAVSRHIKQLEEDLGAPLLTRDSRGVRLTDQGRRLHRSLEPAFNMITGAVWQARHDPQRTRLTVMTVPLFASTWLLPRVPGFGRVAPEVDLVITDSITEEMPGAGAADIVIDWRNTGAEEGAVAEKLTDEELFPVCAPSAWPEDGGLDRATLLHRHSFPQRYGALDWPTFLAAVDRQVPHPHSGPRFAPGLLMDAARTGCGVALATTTIAHDDLAAGRLVRPIPDSTATGYGYWLLLSAAAADRPEVRTFCTWLREELAACFGPRQTPSEG